MENEILQQILETQKQILNKVGTLETTVVRLEQGQAETNSRLDNVDARLDKLEQGQDDLKQGQTRLEIILENEIKPNIQAVAEQHGTIIDKLDGLPEKLIALQDDTSLHKAAITELSKRTANL